MERLLFKRKIKRILYSILGLVLVFFLIERGYNSKAEFHTVVEDEDHYGVIDARFTYWEKSRDFKEMYDVLMEEYPFFKVHQRKYGEDWPNSKSRFKRIIRNTNSDTEFIAAVDNMLGELNDPNTFVLTRDLYNRYFLHYYPDRSEILFNERSPARYNFNGNTNLDLDNDFIFHNGPVLDTKVLMEDEVAYMKIEAMSYYHMEVDHPKIKRFLEEVKDYDKLIIDIRGNQGGFDEYWDKIVKLLINNTYRADYYSFFRHNPTTTTNRFRVPGITTIDNLDENILRTLPEEVQTDFKFLKHNTMEFNPEENVGFNGRIYLLVDNEVITSAEKFAAFSKDSGFATLVGETTGGWMTFAEVPMYYNPYGGYIYSYSKELVLNSDKTINVETGTTPHIIVENTTPQDDYTKDLCIQAVIAD